MILLHERPAQWPKNIVIDDFEDGKPGMWRLPMRDEGVVVKSEHCDRYPCVRPWEHALDPYHDLHVQPIRSLIPYIVLPFRIRSFAPGSAVLVRVAVDDTSPPAPIKL